MRAAGEPCDGERPGWLWGGYHCTLDKELQRTYGMTCGAYWLLLDRQGGACAICGQPPRSQRLNVDHDHDSGEIRGLCHRACQRPVTVAIVRYLTDPPGRALGLAVPPDRERAMERRRARRRVAARRRAAQPQSTPQRRTGSVIAAIERLEQER